MTHLGGPIDRGGVLDTQADTTEAPKGSGRPRSPREISAVMRRVRSSGTGPELAFRRALWARGYRYLVAPAYLPGKPDVVFLSRRVAIFIDGDFWHGNQWRKRKH